MRSWARWQSGSVGQGVGYTAATVAPTIAAFTLTPVLTRQLSAVEYATVATCLILVQAVGMASVAGLPAAITRLVIMDAEGVRSGRGLLLQASAIALLLTGVAGISSPTWVEPLLSYGWRPAVLLAVVSGLGTAVMSVGQSFFRGTGQVGRFMASAMLGTALGQGLGVLGASLSGTADGYFVGHASALVAVGLFTLWRAQVTRHPIFGNLKHALRIGVPTLPHTLAFYLASGSLVLITTRLIGLADGGRLQLALIVGSAPVLLVNALNNVWAPAIYRTARDQRGEVLKSSSFLVAWLMAGVSIAIALVSPVVLGIMAPPRLIQVDLFAASSIVACTGTLAVWYLSNVHLVFAEGRTAGLALASPTSLAVACVFAVMVSMSASLELVASSLILFYVIQGALVRRLSIKVSAITWSQRVLLTPILLSVVGCFATLALPTYEAWKAMRLIAGVLVALIVGWLCWRKFGMYEANGK